MGQKLKLKNRKYTGRLTFGTYALAMFWLVVVSGILLAIPFDVNSPYLSVSVMNLTDIWIILTRNAHFFSSQLFLVLSLLHIYEHFHYKDKVGLKPGMAFRLSIGVLIIFLAMFTGFLLKGDADARQARLILQTLVERIPLIGSALAFSLLGDSDSFMLIYVHHIATFTVFIAIIMAEHSRRVWPPSMEVIQSVFVVLILSILFSAPVHDNLNPTVKGPWYFVGFQEIIHWLADPEWSLLLFFIILILLFWANSKQGKLMFISKRSLLFFTVIYIFLTIIGLFFRGEQWEWKWPGEAGYCYSVLANFRSSSVSFFSEYDRSALANSPVVGGRKESCLVCHAETHGFSDSHRPEAIGCFSCHGGNPFAASKKQAHRHMFLVPGNLASATQSCGTTQCHPDITSRISTGLMATLSGMISVDRYVFNENVTPDALTNVHDLKNSAADEHLKNLCVRCHLGNPKTETGPIDEASRGGGCLACHLNYSEAALDEQELIKGDLHKQHPSISLQVGNSHCFGCHSRSGRISTNYEGWHETVFSAAEMPDSAVYRLVEGNRVFVKKQADVHHQLGLECIDCHHSFELMGDGTFYAHEEDQEDVQCTDCHIEGLPKTIDAKYIGNEPALIAALRFNKFSDKKFLVTQKQNHVLVNCWFENDSVYLITKNSKQKRFVGPPASVCTKDKAHANIACSACHSSWAPTCIGCHNAFDHNEPGYNMLSNTAQKGAWIEYIGTYEAKLPTLGIRDIAGEKEVIPVTPGMVLTIDKKSFTGMAHDSTIFHRLYAPIAPHTTSAKGRSCKSCHNSSVALGYGEGELKYEIVDNRGTWQFYSLYLENINDNLPEDAWIGFLETRKGKVSTRSNVFPFDIEQQKRMLTVGACLTCHDEDSEVMKKSLNNFKDLLVERNVKCILPTWE